MLRPLLLLTSASILLAGCGSAAGPRPARTAASHVSSGSAQQVASRSTTQTTGTTGTAPTAHHQAPWRNACPSLHIGELPPTTQLPSTTTLTFQCEMHALWDGIRTGTLAPAMEAYFPEGAYVQLKAIGDPQGDWVNRLVGTFASDVQAAHALLGADAAKAKLVDVVVPSTYAHLVSPGVCYNRLSYWETPNSRMVYRENGVVRSFGIASMISWRGTWFVVHLGAVIPTVAGGEVDAPSVGPGVAAPSSTC